MILNLEAIERDFVYLLEFDEEIFKYFEKPFKLFNHEVECISSFLVKYYSSKKKDKLICVEKDIDPNKILELSSIYSIKNNLEKITLEVLDVIDYVSPQNRKIL